MKVLPWLCGFSLVANLALVAYTTTRPPSARRDAPPTFALSESAVPKPASASALGDGETPRFNRADTPLAKLLDGSDLAAMCAALEATGLSAEDAKAVIRARIRDRQKAAREAIDQRRNPQDSVWWYQDDQARGKFEEQRRADRKVLNDELSQTLASLFGPEPKPPEKESIHNQAKFLSGDKQLAVSRILQDYEAMERETRPRNYTGATLPSDEEKRAFIAEERRRDLASVLSPEELRAFDLRNSQTANDIRWRAAAMKPTLAEYEAIFDAQDAVNRQFDTRTTDENRPTDFWQKRQEAEQASFAKLREQIGEDRFIDYALSNDHNSRQVSLVVDRYALPKEAPRSLWKLRQEAGRQGKAIFDDSTLSQDEKRARLARLAQSSRQQLNQVLSPEAQSELKQNNLVNWVNELDKNRVTVYSENGNGSSGYGL